MNIFILTGSGISADSGLKTFRDDETGIWAGEYLLHVCTLGAFEHNPSRVNDFYNKRREEVDAHKPNAAHYAIAEYMAKTENNVMLVTQNVDNYHEIAAGNPFSVFKMHGDLYRLFCIKCGDYFNVGKGYQHDIESECSNCGETKTIRPDVVFFGEQIQLDLPKVQKFLKKDADGNRLSHFISIGTSGVVYPAAEFVKQAHFNSKKVYINLDLKDVHHLYNEKVTGLAKDTVPDYFKKLYKEYG